MRFRAALIILSGFIFGISGTAFFSKKGSSRHPSSVSTSKQKWIPAPVGKHLALLKVEIAKPNRIPENEIDEEVTLVGRIFVNQKLEQDLNFRWTLPENVEVVDGLLADSLSGVQVGQIVEVKLTVIGFNKEKQRLVSLEAKSKNGSEFLGGSAVIASRPEDTLESIAPEMKKSADEQLGGSSKSRR